MCSPTGGCPPCFSLFPVFPVRPLWSGDGLGAPDTVLDRAGRKEALGDAAGNENLSDAPQIPLGDALGDAAGDALTNPLALLSVPNHGGRCRSGHSRMIFSSFISSSVFRRRHIFNCCVTRNLTLRHNFLFIIYNIWRFPLRA
jgi:hypothetical protein